jgi:virginiamycin B lyase
VRYFAAILTATALACSATGCRKSAGTSASAETAQPEPPGVPEVQVPFASLKPEASWKIGDTADWVVITPDAVWVAGTKPDSVHRLDPKKNQVIASVPIPAEACSGLEFAFGSIWVPVCTSPPSMLRIDAKTNQLRATLNVGPGGPEGGIAASSDSIWLVTDKSGILSRIDPATNSVRQTVKIPAGSFNPVYSESTIWVSGFDSNALIPFDAASGIVRESIAVGPKPRFLVADVGSIWTLNQGDGTISRVDAKTRKLVATVSAGLPGEGGDICYGGGFLWATLFGLPLTRVDPATNKVVRQWKGPGGDSMRFGHGAIWLTDYRKGLLNRIPLADALKP